ncbi:acyl carrier protein [Xinfangfangia pollutisoli]|uniref:acyl carrier protein n=1 Tax=Xinfangfangia pollutisoli TaxID=2865960 RepID=UPI001CD5BCF9|nr:acyl carrier protein [Xinfangfangia pollutisoli]
MLSAESIAELFSSVLGLDCDPDDSFFDLGGDSLSAVTLMTRLSALAGQPLPVSLLLDCQSPAELAAYLRSAPQVAGV